MERTVFTGGAVFDATGADPAPGEVVVDGDRIVEVRSGWAEDHGTARVVNIAGRTIMPGLIESHAHLTFPSAVGHIDPIVQPAARRELLPSHRGHGGGARPGRA